MSYTKLFSSIVNSTIWLEDDPTRPALLVTEPGVGYRLKAGR